MPAKLTGVSRVNRNIDRRIKEIEQITLERALYSASTVAAPYIDIRTAIDTSNLIDSRYITQPKKTPNGWRVTIGFTANYARYVHDPKVKQTFKKPTATKEFLVRGIDDAYPEMTRTFKWMMKI